MDTQNKIAEKIPPREVKITADQDGQRLDRVVQKLLDAGFGQVQMLCRKGAIRLDGKRVKGNERVAAGQVLRLPSVEKQPEDAKPQVRLNPQQKRELRSRILYEDDDMLVIDKAAGVPVQAGSKNFLSLDRMMACLYAEAPKLTHRIDKETSGCVLFAKTTAAARELTRQFAEREVDKTYWAVVHGELIDNSGEIDFPLKKSTGNFERMQAHADGDEAITRYKRLARTGSWHWLEVKPETGRTHQIRAHMAAIGVPLLGDEKYAGDDDAFSAPGGKVKNLFLHAVQVNFIHPRTGQPITVKAPMPDHFEQLFSHLRWN